MQKDGKTEDINSYLWKRTKESAEEAKTPRPKFTDDLRTMLKQFSDLRQSCDLSYLLSFTFYLKTKSYDHLLDVLRQLGSDSQDRRPIVVRFILKYTIR